MNCSAAVLQINSFLNLHYFYPIIKHTNVNSFHGKAKNAPIYQVISNKKKKKRKFIARRALHPPAPASLSVKTVIEITLTFGTLARRVDVACTREKGARENETGAPI